MKTKIFLAAITVTAIIFLCWYILNSGIKIPFYKAKPPNIIVILIDTLRADHLGSYGYKRDTSPNIDQLAMDSLVFQKAIASASWTAPAVSTVLSGLYPSQHTNQPVRERGKALKLGSKLPSSVLTLAERLKARGYNTNAISANPWITKEFGLDQGFDNFYYFNRSNAQKVVKSAKKIVGKSRENATQPLFLYMHFMDPHSPYTPEKSFADLFKNAAKDVSYEEKDQAKINLYDAEIHYTDYHIGKFIEFLKGKDFYKDSVIVLLADHGEAFHEHGTGGHGYQLFMEEVHVPLIMKIPGNGGSVKETVSQIDIVPTLLDVIGESPDISLPGISLLKTDQILKRTGIYSEVYRVFKQQAFSTTEGERLIKDFGNRKSPFLTSSFGLFNINKDPYEQSPINAPEIVAEIEGYLQTVIQSNQNAAKAEEVTISGDTLKKLESLGYINE